MRNRLQDAGLYPLPARHKRDDILDAIDAPLPTYTPEELQQQRERVDELLAKLQAEGKV